IGQHKPILVGPTDCISYNLAKIVDATCDAIDVLSWKINWQVIPPTKFKSSCRINRARISDYYTSIIDSIAECCIIGTVPESGKAIPVEQKSHDRALSEVANDPTEVVDAKGSGDILSRIIEIL